MRRWHGSRERRDRDPRCLARALVAMVMRARRVGRSSISVGLVVLVLLVGLGGVGGRGRSREDERGQIRGDRVLVVLVAVVDGVGRSGGSVGCCEGDGFSGVVLGDAFEGKGEGARTRWVRGGSVSSEATRSRLTTPGRGRMGETHTYE